MQVAAPESELVPVRLTSNPGGTPVFGHSISPDGRYLSYSDAAGIHVLPTLWFRNEWSWGGQAERPLLRQVSAGDAGSVISAAHGPQSQKCSIW